MTIERIVDGGEAAVDFGFGGCELHPVEQRMRERVVRDRMAVCEFAARKGGRGDRVASEQEEGRVDALALERIEHPRRGGWPRAIIECEHHLFGRQRERLWKMLAANPQSGCGIDREDALSPERVGISGARRALRRIRDERTARASY